MSSHHWLLEGVGRGRLVLLIALVLFGHAARPARSDPGAQVDLLQNDNEQIVLRYAFDDFSRIPVRIDGELYDSLALGRESLKFVRGEPALPDVSRSVIVPDDAHVTIKVRHSEYYELADIDVTPSKGLILRDVNPDTVPYTFGDVYKTDAFFPNDIAVLHKPYIMRDHRGVLLTVNPFQYNPVQRVLRVYTGITVEISADGPGKHNVRRGRAAQIRAGISFEDIYQNHFLNYDPAAQDVMSEDGNLLIICHDQWLPEIQPLVDHKSATGINTTVVSAALVGNSAVAIKNYIQGVYDTTNLSFVLLVGDAAQIATPYAALGAADPTYSLLAGDDPYPEVIVGRFSAESAADVATQVERTIAYETTGVWNQEWFRRGMGIASDQGPGDDGELDREHVDHIRDKLISDGYTEVDQIYDPSASWLAVFDGLNLGRGIVNYCGHGSWNGWSTSYFNSEGVNALTNVGELPLVICCACNNGEFDDYTCFAETWLRATHNGEPSGGVGVYACSGGQYWNPPMAAQDEITDLLLARAYSTFGAICFAGSCLMMDEYPAPYGEQNGGGVDMFYNWILFGDPSLRIAEVSGMRILPTGDFKATGRQGGPFEPAAQTYLLTNRDADPIAYSVTCDAPWIDIGASEGVIPAGGNAEVTISLNDLVGGFDDGHYEGSIEFVNQTNHEGDAWRGVSLDISTPDLIYAFDMNNDPGWSMTGEWEFGEPTGQGGGPYGLPDPTSGATGSNVCGVNLNGNYATEIGGPFYLTTTALDCSDLTQVSVSFQRWLNTDYQPYAGASVDVSIDGVEWLQLWDNPGSPGDLITDFWARYVYNLAAIADGQPTVYLRWGYAIGEPDAFPYSGWNIDDVELWGIDLALPCPADINGDGAVNMNDLVSVLASWGPCDECVADIDGDNIVGLSDLLGVLATWGDCP